MNPISSMFLSLVARTLIFCSFCLASNCCKVEVTEPWERTTYVPQGSSVHFNCTVSKSEQTLIIWSILLVGTDTPSQFGFPESINLLNSRGFYELPMVTTGSDCTIQLLMNSTENNNGTVVRCDGISPTALLQETNIVIFDPVSVILSATDTQLQSVNLSWTPPPQFPATPKYTLRVTSANTDTVVHQTSETYFSFAAPPNAPPCEVYNFSVTATPVGATYTGVGCSVPSPVLSRMLPSLPDIRALETSLNYSLSGGRTGITLKVSYHSLNHCEMYPLINYTLEIRGGASQDVQSVTSTTNQITVRGLSENELHRFNITAFNSVGSVKTSEVQFYTTDVQSIIVKEVQADEDGVSLKIQCDFIATSNARGCMVVLTGEDDSTSLTIMKRQREHSSINEVFSVNRSLSCYHRIEAFDIESDGSIGTIAISGNSEGTTQAQCYSTRETYSGSSTFLNCWLLTAIISFLSMCV